MKTEIRESVLLLSGEVRVTTVTNAAYRQFRQACENPQVNTIDLSGVTRADSACLSLLLAAVRRKEGQPAIRSIPPSVAALAELYDIQEWIRA
ncbi:MAG: STAS domain-containing protein [Neisseria sp.]|uniref:STAS domain-containing protein n=1 Tax=Neisseria sp. TaxID=192066 RepID=UPI0026DBFD0B|nr:STAS domain-containing protein [Neisseria sp.]MDO4641925.1 STAS domain-containing protein [Neisseria sp.]